MNYTKKILLFLLLAIVPITINAQKKNVLFIAIDDLKPILGCYGDTIIKTPNIDKLAKQGVVFRNNHCQQAVCAPSRASLLTGTRPDYTKVWDLKTLIRDRNPDILTIPQYFKNLGYETTGTGKIFDLRSVDNQHDEISWSKEFKDKGNEDLYDSKYGKPVLHYYQEPETRKLAQKYIAEAEKKGLKGHKRIAYALKKIKPSTECLTENIPDNAYIDGVITLTATNQMKKFAKSDNPFFLAVGFKRPHLPFAAPKKYWDLYDRDKLPLAKYQKIAENSPDFAYHNSGELRSYSDIPPINSFSDIAEGILPNDKQKELIHGYYAAVSYIDAQVGKILNTLDSLGLRKNTVIVLWGDHGWHLGDHGLWCKHTNYEQATRSPLIFSTPGNKPGYSDKPTEFIDVFPTLCELVGLPIPKQVEGNSLKKVISGESSKTKEYAVSQFHRGKDRMGYAFRTERFRYVVWLKNRFRSTQKYNKELIVGEELYDYNLDPLETKNVVKDKNYKKEYKKLKELSIDFFSDYAKTYN